MRSSISKRCCVGLLAVALCLAGCDGDLAQSPTTDRAQTSVGLGSFHPSNARARASSTDSDPWLYVDGSNNAVNVYDVAQPGNRLVLTITQGVSNPVGLKVDNQGTLYVANSGNGTVAEYPFGQNAPALTLSMNSPADIALDPTTGALYVDTRVSPPGIYVFKKGHTQPSKYIISNLLVLPSQMLFDSSGTLYIADNQTGVSVVQPNHRVVSLDLQDLDGCTSGIALDEHTSDLYVSACGGGIQVYALGNEYPIRSLVDSLPADYLAIGALGKGQDLFAPDIFADTVYVYHANAKRSFEVIMTGSQNALGIAIKPANIPR